MKASLFVLISFCIWQIHSAPVPLPRQEEYQDGPVQEEQTGSVEEVDVERDAEIPAELVQQSQLLEERRRAKRQAQDDEETIDADEFRSEVQRSRRHGSHRDYRLCFVPPFPLWCYDYHKRRSTTTTTTTTPISDITTRTTRSRRTTTTTTTTPFSDITTRTTRRTTTTTTTPFSDITTRTTRRTTTTTPFSDITTSRYPCHWWWMCSSTTTTTTPISDVPITTTTTTTPFSDFPTTTTTPFSDITLTSGSVPRIRFEHAVVKANKKLSKASNIFGYLKRYEQQY
ncbi:hypothetical protein TTRE_0000054801 [Trichuris trichiura]|uniref:Uncharacterized protein n=1 Tax=Trichuris trichiura TaxID=36087 RepID=A0A077YX18_TRITR|nr:hypothetical protein TTRE_0000054801 [Trichuris trichiura]